MWLLKNFQQQNGEKSDADKQEIHITEVKDDDQVTADGVDAEDKQPNSVTTELTPKKPSAVTNHSDDLVVVKQLLASEPTDDVGELLYFTHCLFS
ncbi:unnamed protein product [Echinostoma caproni]|uniref:Ovule protein n=1 Tax=Echinostoma caproni TaxID=27848 RepID=A0A183BH46_9TREM|nr:unnamed protein product [Echinostoma caproni]